ncbi:MAG: HAMP domain-containing protein [Clostridia bacterium]|nr:HAMP domain-containing protein [Clostridia bacterium]
MLKSIQQKLVLIFVLIILAIMLVLGTFLFSAITNFYHDDFKSQMENTFNQDVIKQLEEASKSENAVNDINMILDVYSGVIGIDSYRNYYVLDGKTAEYLTGTDPLYGETITKTPNILSALTGKMGNEVKSSGEFMEYAVPLPQTNPPSYIVYIHDTKVEMNDFIFNLIKILLQALVFGLITVMLIAYLLSKTITTPILELTSKAEKLAKGNFEKFPTVEENDELGILSNTFKYMSETLQSTLGEIEFEKNKLETVMKYMSDGIIAFDHNGKILVINPAAKNFLGIRDESSIQFDEFFAEYFEDLYMGDYIYLYTDKREERIKTVNDIALKFYFSTLKLGNDNHGGIMVVIQDITKQENIERSRREFVANVSHELKTPITTVKSYVETMIETPDLDNSMRKSFLSVVDKETDRMTRLVQDLLTLSRLDSNMIKENREYFDVAEAISDVVNSLAFEAEKHNHNMTFKTLNEIPPIYMDKDKLGQVLINLVSNAIKYTPDGGEIKITAHSINDIVTIKVKDSGIGIPKKDLERIFERFYRVDKARSRSEGGTGLGLAIAKEIINHFGGEIFIESEFGEGTEASIVLPIDGNINKEEEKNIYKF